MTTTESTLEGVIGRQTYGPLGYLASRQTFWVFLAAVIAVIYLSSATTSFDTPQNLFNVTRNFAFVGIIALGMTAVIITGGIDLSVGSVLALTGMVTGMLMSGKLPVGEWSIWAAIPAGLAAALLTGAVNGWLIAYLGMPPFVVTLGMMSLARSLAMVLSNNQMVYQFGHDHARLVTLGGRFVSIPIPFYGAIDVPNPALTLVILALCFGFAFRWTRWGRYIFAIGGNEQAATLTGVPVKMIKMSVYMLSALMAGIAGILMVGWLGTITTGMGTGYELIVIAAVVIGGANLTGGSGTAFGAVVGAALIEVIRNSLTLLGINPFWQGTFVGSFIIIAVMFDRLRSFRQRG
jgi:ribose transport system permease protein